MSQNVARSIRANTRASVVESTDTLTEDISASENVTENVTEYDISEPTKAYLEKLIKSSTDLMVKKMEETEARLEAKLEESEAKVAELSRRLDRSKYEIRALKIENDDLQQYTRRHSIRMEGLEYRNGESEDDLFAKIKEKLAEVDINVNENDITRYHRSAKPKKNKNGLICAQTIVKFANWKMRKLAH